MPALFSRHSNRLTHRLLTTGGALLLGVPLLLYWWVRSPYVTGQGHSADQPIPLFSHQIHVTGLRIDCRYCHNTAERAAAAGMPSTQSCIPCHNAVWLESGIFAPVRRSLATGRPIPWERVNRLPDFVFFNHAVHVNRGIGCESCHGRVESMAQVHQTAPLTMKWCLDCHRNPKAHSTIGVDRLTTCTACHR